MVRMTIEENKVVVRRFYEEVLSRGNLDLIEDLFAPDYVVKTGLGAGSPSGPAAARRAAQELRTGVPDAQYTVEDLIAEGDMVVVHRVMRGTHRGEFQGIPATDKPVTVPGLDIFRLADGKIAERWTISDQLGLLQQIGVVPAPGPVN